MTVAVLTPTKDYHQLSLANLKTLAERLGSANEQIFKHHGDRSIQAIVTLAEAKYRLAFVASRMPRPVWKHVHDLTVGGLCLLDRARARALALSNSPAPGS